MEIQIRVNGSYTVTYEGDDIELLSEHPNQPGVRKLTAYDYHVHTNGCQGGTINPSAIVQLMAERELHIASCFVWGNFDGWAVDRLEFTGSDHEASEPGRVLHYELEISPGVTSQAWPAAKLGHLVGLGLNSIEFAETLREGPGSTVPIAYEMRSQNAVIGMAHGQSWPAYGDTLLKPGGHVLPYEAPVLAALGLLDFLGTEGGGDGQPLHLGALRLWQHLLNAGYKVVLTGGSDFSCISQVPGNVRTLYWSDGQPSYMRTLEALRAGETVISTAGNHNLDLTVNGVGIGGEVHFKYGDKATVQIETDKDGDVDLLLNGAIWHTITVRNGIGQLVVNIQTPSYWLSARTATLQTSAVYCIVDNKPIRNLESINYLIASIDQTVDMINEGLFGESAKDSLEHCEEARSNLVAYE